MDIVRAKIVFFGKISFVTKNNLLQIGVDGVGEVLVHLFLDQGAFLLGQRVFAAVAFPGARVHDFGGGGADVVDGPDVGGRTGLVDEADVDDEFPGIVTHKVGCIVVGRDFRFG